MRQMKDYFTTGQFAKICQVKKQTLFHYDDIGIFKPEITSSNGYRYYSYTQIETFAVLTMFKELNVPLKEIKVLMDNRSPEALIKSLESKKIEINQKIKRLQMASNYVDEKIKVTQEGINAPMGKIVFENLPDEFLITTDYGGTDDEKAVAEAVSEHFNYCHSLGVQSAYSIGGIIPKASLTKDGHKYSKFYTVVNQSFNGNHSHDHLILDSGGTYICIYDNHGYKNITSLCLGLIEYAEIHNFTLGDCFYEDVILDDLSVHGYYNYVVKVSAKINDK